MNRTPVVAENAPVAVVIAEFRDGGAAYFRGEDGDKWFTDRKRWAFKMGVEDAHEEASRLNGVADRHNREGHPTSVHNRVSYYRVAVLRRYRGKRRSPFPTIY